MIYAQPGQLVDVGGFRLNLYCMGSGSPTVVFDSGFGDWAPAWSKVQPQIAKWTRACSYDRAGAGFSDPGPMPRTSVRIAGELRTALHNAGIAGPYILVGSAFGGDNVRTFADLYYGRGCGAGPGRRRSRRPRTEGDAGRGTSRTCWASLGFARLSKLDCRAISRCRLNRRSWAATTDLCSAVFLSGLAGSGVVSGVERQSPGNRANQSCHV